MKMVRKMDFAASAVAGMCLTMSVGANLMGDSVRDLMDPKLRKNF